MPARFLLLFGPPGAGKGTQARILCRTLGLPHVSTGDMFRDHLSRETELGLTVKRVLAAGDLVPDELTNEMVRERLSREDAANGALLDGYPRNVNQASTLERMLADRDCPLEAIISLKLDPELLRRRLAARAQKENRPDDADPSVIQHRIDTYLRETAPCEAYYDERGAKVCRIDGFGSIEEVTSRILTCLG